MKSFSSFSSFLLLFILLLVVQPVQAAEPVPEFGLISYVDYYGDIKLTDVNLGLDGKLYVTDNEADAVIVLSPQTGQYNVYSLALLDINDVQPAPDHQIWYTDNKNMLGVFNPNDCHDDQGLIACNGNVWPFPNLGADQDYINIGPLAFDNQGYVWVGDFGGTIQRLYRVKPTNTTTLEYCRFDIGVYHAHDLKYFNNQLWIGDWAADRLIRFNPATNTLASWALGSGASPTGIAFDASGSLWWADETTGRIGNLVFGSGSAQLTYYDVPGTALPRFVAPLDGSIWYTDQLGTVGRLIPAAAAPISSASVPEMSLGTITPELCEPKLTTGDGSSYLMEANTLTFSPFTPALVPDKSTGWEIYSLPGGAVPFGIAAINNMLFVADSSSPGINLGRLVRIAVPTDQYKVFLPLIRR